jgi:hypothetical protein
MTVRTSFKSAKVVSQVALSNVVDSAHSHRAVFDFLSSYELEWTETSGRHQDRSGITRVGHRVLTPGFAAWPTYLHRLQALSLLHEFGNATERQSVSKHCR